MNLINSYLRLKKPCLDRRFILVYNEIELRFSMNFLKNFKPLQKFLKCAFVKDTNFLLLPIWVYPLILSYQYYTKESKAGHHLTEIFMNFLTL